MRTWKCTVPSAVAPDESGRQSHLRIARWLERWAAGDLDASDRADLSATEWEYAASLATVIRDYAAEEQTP